MTTIKWMRGAGGVLALGMISLGACGDDSTTPPPSTDVTVDPLNTSGFQFETPVFEVPEGVEMQDCYFVEMPDLNGDGSDIWIDKFRIGVNGGSHHTNIFRVKTIVALDGAPGTMVHDGECFKSANWADWPLIANNQRSGGLEYYTWELPTDVGYRFTVGEKLMIQTHYVNAATQPTPYRGKVAIDFYLADGTPPMEMGTLFATQQSIRVCASTPEVSYSGTCRFPAGVNVEVAAANGHFHSRGTEFEIFGWDGTSETRPPMSERFYDSQTWDEPPMSVYPEGQISIAENGGIWWTCSYEWTPPSVGCDVLNEKDAQMANDCCYTFGPRVEENEHCNVFLYYWPAVPRSDIFCN